MRGREGSSEIEIRGGEEEEKITKELVGPAPLAGVYQVMTQRSCPCPEPGVLCRANSLCKRSAPFQLQLAHAPSSSVSQMHARRTHTPESTPAYPGGCSALQDRISVPIPAVPGPASFTQNELFHPLLLTAIPLISSFMGPHFSQRSYLPCVSSSRPWAPRRGRCLIQLYNPICHML